MEKEKGKERKRLLEDEDEWNMVWKDTPFHGTPGG